MTIQEAIEYYELEAKGLMDYNDPNWKKTTKLGYEALRRILATRLVRKTGTVVPLPGETDY